MTKAIVLLPGIEGSELALDGETIWPPKPAEIISKRYKRLGKLMDPRAKAVRVPDAIQFVDIYKYLLDNLKVVADSCPALFYAFPYDWRKDNIDSAKSLDKFITKIRTEDGVTGVTLVGHSMGGLVSRILLERNPPSANRDIVDGLVAVATPHLGSPLGLAAGLEIHSGGLLSGKEVKALAADTNFPALYQLFPHRGLKKLIDSSGAVQDVFDQSIAERYGLSWANVKKAAAQNAQMNFSRSPPKTRYVLINGTGLDTLDVITFDVGDLDSYRHTETDGDDTVPLWSGMGISPVDEAYSVSVQGGKAWSLLGGHANQILHSGVEHVMAATWRCLGCG